MESAENDIAKEVYEGLVCLKFKIRSDYFRFLLFRISFDMNLILTL
jgi:hypothetical protein